MISAFWKAAMVVSKKGFLPIYRNGLNASEDRFICCHHWFINGQAFKQ
jgi:hypothetical protein